MSTEVAYTPRRETHNDAWAVALVGYAMEMD